MDFEKLDDKGVLITGGADGIGLALAEMFRSAGARVFVGDIAAEKLEKSAARIGASCAACDVTDADQIEQWFERAWDEIGPIESPHDLKNHDLLFTPSTVWDAWFRSCAIAGFQRCP